jgi:NAD(P)-dependent dehydrogenase (short-subunit alcohol dehydrogenase family)
VILVTGATGLNGSEVVRCLSARGVPVRALVRDIRKAQTLAQLPGVTVVEGDMSQTETLREPLRDIDRAMLISSADARIASIDVADIAEVAAAVLTNDGHAGKTYPLTGVEALTMSEVAERLTAALDRQVQYVDIPPDVYRDGLIAAGVPPFNSTPMRLWSSSSSDAKVRKVRCIRRPSNCLAGGRRAFQNSPNATPRFFAGVAAKAQLISASLIEWRPSTEAALLEFETLLIATESPPPRPRSPRTPEPVGCWQVHATSDLQSATRAPVLRALSLGAPLNVADTRWMPFQ